MHFTGKFASDDVESFSAALSSCCILIVVCTDLLDGVVQIETSLSDLFQKCSHQLGLTGVSDVFHAYPATSSHCPEDIIILLEGDNFPQPDVER